MVAQFVKCFRNYFAHRRIPAGRHSCDVKQIAEAVDRLCKFPHFIHHDARSFLNATLQRDWVVSLVHVLNTLHVENHHS